MEISGKLPPTAPVEPVPKTTDLDKALKGETTPRIEAGAAESRSAPLTREAIEPIVEALNVQTQMVHRNLRFAVDDATGRTVITLSDSQSGEVIRQIPSDAVLRLAERLAEQGMDPEGSGKSTSGRAGYGVIDESVRVGVGTLLNIEF